MSESPLDLARIIGLWLAEGDKKSSNEVTITNNDPFLIRLFHDSLWAHFRPRNSPRIYVYRPTPAAEFVRPVENVRYRTYIDRRANVPYFIYRVAGVELVREWKKTVRALCKSPSNYQGILQGFFAGEGNIKETKTTHSRSLRISQGQRMRLVESDFAPLWSVLHL